jgi:hypothetical protein
MVKRLQVTGAQHVRSETDCYLFIKPILTVEFDDSRHKKTALGRLF